MGFPAICQRSGVVTERQPEGEGGSGSMNWKVPLTATVGQETKPNCLVRLGSTFNFQSSERVSLSGPRMWMTDIFFPAGWLFGCDMGSEGGGCTERPSWLGPGLKVLSAWRGAPSPCPHAAGWSPLGFSVGGSDVSQPSPGAPQCLGGALPRCDCCSESGPRGCGETLFQGSSLCGRHV